MMYVTASFSRWTRWGLNQGSPDYKYVECCIEVEPKLFVEHGVVEVVKGSLMVHLYKLLYILVFTVFVIRFL